MRRLVLLMGAVALVVSACAASDGASAETSASTLATTTTAPPTTTTTTTLPPTTTTTTAESEFPVTIVAENGEVTIPARPARIVSISPTSTEVLFAIGAGDQVVAVDSLSNFPAGAPVTDLSGFSPNVEAIAAFDPDLVFLSFDPDGGLIPALEAIGVPAILHSGAFDVESAYGQWLQVGAATGHADGAMALVDETRQRIDDAYASLGGGAEGLSYYWELDQTFFSVTSATFVGDLLSGTSMDNIADPADEAGFGYPQLTAEYIIGSDPDLIYLADTLCCGQTVDTVAERPGWDAMTAVQDGQVIELNDDVASRWGPRIADLVEQIAEAIASLSQ